MTRAARELLTEVLGLPEEDRLEIAAEIIASVDGEADPDAESEWAREVERRARRAVAGESTGTDWEVVRERVAKKLRSR